MDGRRQCFLMCKTMSCSAQKQPEHPVVTCLPQVIQHIPAFLLPCLKAIQAFVKRRRLVGGIFQHDYEV